MNETKNKLQLSSPEPSERLLKIFEFLKTYLDLRYPHVRDVSQQMRVLWLNDLAQHPAIEIFHPNGDADQESEDESDIVLRITRPGLTHCPTPPAAIADWLKPGWQEIDAHAEVLPTRPAREKNEPVIIERFEDVPQRPAAFRKWQEERAEWQQMEQPARQALAVFQSVYEWFGIHEREAEQIELLVGDCCSDWNWNFIRKRTTRNLSSASASSRRSSMLNSCACFQRQITSRLHNAWMN